MKQKPSCSSFIPHPSSFDFAGIGSGRRPHYGKRQALTGVTHMANTQVGNVLRQLNGAAPTRAAEGASDCELLERYLAGREEAAFVALLRRHGPMVLSVCRRAGGNLQDAE